jgi:anaerobic magnesium-protoporphyrin IX monomethyl ester cyclase
MNPARLDEKKVVFVTPPSAFTAYTGTAINAATQVYPYLPYQYLSAWLKKLGIGFKTAALDMGLEADPWCALAVFLLRERPKYVGLSFTTPLFYEANLIGLIAKNYLGPDLVVAHGGVHASALPEESLKETMCDAVVISEGEVTFGEICQGKPLNEIRGILYRADANRKQVLSAQDILRRLKSGQSPYAIHLTAVQSGDADIKRNLPREFIRSKKNKSLDDLPFPDMELFNILKYRNPRVIARGYPMQQVETSRGCPFSCNFCSSENTYRAFSPDYTVAMFEYMTAHCGVRELRIIDDQFLINIKRGKMIAEKMLQKGLIVPWNMANGVRADRVDKEFIDLAARSGCYQIGAGYESGDQAALDSLQKSLNIEKSLECIQMIKEAGIETVGFFMIGAKADTLESMEKTIDFAKKLMPDFAKVTVCIPFPDTKLFTEYDQQGLILSRKWDDYNIHKAVGVFRHPNGLTPEILTHYYWKFYREFYGNADYLEWFIPKSFADGSVLWKAKAATKLIFAKTMPDDPKKYLVLE